MPRVSRPSEEEVANSLVRKRIKLRNRMLTFGEWMEGWGVQVDKEEEEDDLIYQIVVLHDDEYVRTYTVNHKEFEVIKESGIYDQSTDAKFKGTECMILDKKTSISEARMHKMMKARPFRGGCSNGKQMVASKGIGNMKDMRIQYWDTTQATWYAGKILGMWKEKPRTHWLVFFDDGTEYAVGRTDDVWKLDAGETLIEGSAGTVTLAQSGDSDKKQLEFIVETTAPMERLHVTSWKHGVQVFQCGKHAAEATIQASTKSSSKRRRITAEPACTDAAATEQTAAVPNSDRAAIPGSRVWVLSSHSPLEPGEMKVAHTPGVLKVTVPVK